MTWFTQSYSGSHYTALVHVSHFHRLMYEMGREAALCLRRRDDAATLARVIIQSTGRETGALLSGECGGTGRETRAVCLRRRDDAATLGRVIVINTGRETGALLSGKCGQD